MCRLGSIPVSRLTIVVLTLVAFCGCGQLGPGEKVAEWNGYDYFMHAKDDFNSRGVIVDFALADRNLFCSGPFYEGPGTTLALSERGKQRVLRVIGDDEFTEFIKTVREGTKVRLTGSFGTLVIKSGDEVADKVKSNRGGTMVHVTRYEVL